MKSENKTKAEERYKSAALELQRVILAKNTSDRLGEIAFPNFEIHGTENKAKALAEALESIIQARSEMKNKQELKRRIDDIVIGWFKASYPFVTLLITVAKEMASVILI